MSQKESTKEFAARMGVFMANRQAFPQEELPPGTFSRCNILRGQFLLWFR